MGRSKLPLKKIENPISRQVTYSKRRVGLLKKAYEIATLCDIDVALVMLSPSDRLTCFSSKSLRIEDVFACYLSLPEQEREEIKKPQFLYKMLRKSRKETDMTSSKNPEEIKKIEELHREISRTQQEIKAKAKILRLFEDGSMGISSSPKEAESQEKLLLDLIGRYDQRLLQLEGQQNGGELAVEDQPMNYYDAYSEMLSKENNNLPQGNGIHHPPLPMDTTQLQSEFCMQPNSPMHLGTEVSAGYQYSFGNQCLFDGSSSSVGSVVAPQSLLDVYNDVEIAMQGGYDGSTPGHQPMMQQPTEGVPSEYSVENLLEHCDSMQRLESGTDDLESLLAAWVDGLDKENETFVPTVGENQTLQRDEGIKKPEEFFLSEEFLTIPPDTNSRFVQAEKEEDNRFMTDEEIMSLLADPDEK